MYFAGIGGGPKPIIELTGDSMKQEDILRVQIEVLNQETLNFYRQKILEEVKVLDAEVPVGDVQVDMEISNVAKAAAQGILAKERLISVRETKIKELQAQLDSLTK